MLSKKEYLDLKHEVKNMCRKNVLLMISDMGLSEEESTLLLRIYDNDTKVAISLDMNITERALTKRTRKLFEKINDYKNTFK